ncbi:DUF397 domain-containing protein [Streptomyces sp. NPDC003042]
MGGSEFGAIDISGAVWVKSSYSGGDGACVEVARIPGGAVAVRDSKDVSRTPLRLSVGQWSAFQRGIAHGVLPA